MEVSGVYILMLSQKVAEGFGKLLLTEVHVPLSYRQHSIAVNG